MGYIRHHALIVTGSSRDDIDRAHETAVELVRLSGLHESMVTPVQEPPGVNGSRSFAVLPDGSKEGWDDSAKGDAFRAALVGYLANQAHDDGSSPLAWCLVQFGDDEGHDGLLWTDRMDGIAADAEEVAAAGPRVQQARFRRGYV